MILLNSTSDLLRVVTGSAASYVDVHVAWVDMSGTTITSDRRNWRISTATSTDIVPSPGSGVSRNVKGVYITNNSSGTNCNVSVRHYDGTNEVEIIEFVLLPGENMAYREDGLWVHRDSQGAEYPAAGLGAYTGYAVPFMKSGTGADTAGYWYCTSKDGGFPGAWAPGTPGVAGRATDGQTSNDYGCIPIINASSGSNFLTEIQMAGSVNHSHLFFDCLWVNSGIVVTTTTAQTVNSVALPARDINGTTNGEGCMIAMLTTTANTNAAAIANATVSYTNSKGVSGRTATLTAVAGSQITISPVIGTITWFNLQAGDTGVQSIQSVTLGTSLVAGAVSFMITRDIATIGTTVANVTAQKVIGAPGIKLFNGSCLLHCYLASATTATFMSGEFTVMQK